MLKIKNININLIKIVLIIIFSISFLLFSDWELAVVPVMIILFFLIIEIVLILVVGNKVNIEIKMPESMVKGEQKPIKVVITNSGILPVPIIKARIKFSNVYTGEIITRDVTLGLIPKAKSVKDFSLRSDYAGVVISECTEILFYGLLGILGKCRTISEKDKMKSAASAIYPNVTNVNLNLDELESYDVESFKYAENKVGNDSSEILGIRKMKPQDSLKLIHWKLSAKLSELVVKELSYPVDNRIMIVFDAMGFDDFKLADKAAEVLTAISLKLTRLHISHGISWYDESLNSVKNTSIDREEEIYRTLFKVMERGNRRDYEKVPSFTGIPGYSGYIVITRNPGLIERMKPYGAVTEFKIEEFK